MAPINKSGLAVVNYTYSGDSLVHTRLYYQDSEGNICEKRLNNTSDRAQNVDKVLGKARSHTEIVAVAWLGHIRIYYFDENDQLVEQAIDEAFLDEKNGDGWFYGNLRNCVASKQSALAIASDFSTGIEIRVYYQGPDRNIYEATHWRHQLGSWEVRRLEIPVASEARLASTFLPNGISLCVYSTDVQNHLVELYTDGRRWGEWMSNVISPNKILAPESTGIACISWSDHKKDRVAVFTVTPSGQLECNETSGSRESWHPPYIIAKNAKPKQIVAIKHGTGYRVYSQNDGGSIIEYSVAGGMAELGGNLPCMHRVVVHARRPFWDL